MTDKMYADRVLQMALVRRNDFLNEVQSLKEAKNDAGERIFNEAEIAERFGVSVSHLRRKISIITRIEIGKLSLDALEMKGSGKSDSDIAKELGLNENTVRALLC